MSEMKIIVDPELAVAHLKNKVGHSSTWVNDSFHLAHDSPHKLFFKIALPNTISIVRRFAELSKDTIRYLLKQPSYLRHWLIQWNTILRH